MSGISSQSVQKPWIDMGHFLDETTLSCFRVCQQAVISISHYFSADVCTLYGFYENFLILLASEGMFPEARFKPRLALGQGIIGEVAKRQKPISLVNVRTSGVYEYFPESGEERYKSLLAVPVLYEDHLYGVLSIQTMSERFYAPAEIHELELYAHVMGKYLHKNFKSIFNITVDEKQEAFYQKPLIISGVTKNTGFADGRAIIHRGSGVIHEISSANPSEEMQRFDEVLQQMYEELDKLAKSESSRVGTRDIIQSYKALSQDEVWISKVKAEMETGLTLEGALQKTMTYYTTELSASKNPYFMSRISDIEDLTNRLMSYVLIKEKPASSDVFTKTNRHDQKKIIVIAHRLGPIELIEYYRHGLAGLVIEEPEENSHAIILAKSFGIPVITNAYLAMDQIRNNDEILVDAEKGLVWVRPDSEATKEFCERRKRRSQILKLYEKIRSAPAVTQDGICIQLMINAALSSDFENLDYVDGIGLYRSEIPFMLYPDFPGIETQTIMYENVFDALQGKPLCFRLLDIGGDKSLPALTKSHENNPHMGWRAIRVGLDMPMILRHQIRSLLTAANGRTVTVFIPMVAEISEVEAVVKIIEMEKKIYKKPSDIRLGVVVEVPSISWELKNLMPHVQSISLGSNDLLQFFYASDRMNQSVNSRYSCLSVSFLRYLKYHLDVANAAHVEISICGEMASSPLEALVLLGLGFRRISVSPSAVPEIKLMIRSVDLQAFANYIHHLINQDDDNIRLSVQSYARDHDIILE